MINSLPSPDKLTDDNREFYAKLKNIYESAKGINDVCVDYVEPVYPIMATKN